MVWVFCQYDNKYGNKYELFTYMSWFIFASDGLQTTSPKIDSCLLSETNLSRTRDKRIPRNKSKPLFLLFVFWTV